MDQERQDERPPRPISPAGSGRLWTELSETAGDGNENSKNRRPDVSTVRRTRRRQQRIMAYLLLLIRVSILIWPTRSWSPSPFINSRTSIIHTKGLLYSQHEGEFSDLKIIQSIKLAKTAQDIRNVLLGDAKKGSIKDSKRFRSSLSPVDSTSPDNTQSIPHQMMEEDDDHMHQSEFENLSLNVTAAALRRLSHVSLQEARRRESDENLIKYRKELLAKLLENAGRKVVETHRAIDESAQLLDITALVDIIEALSILSQPRLGKESHMQPLARLVVGLILRHDDQGLYRLGPFRLVQCLQSLTALKLDDDSEKELKAKIFARLLKPDAVSKLNPATMSYALMTLSTCAKTDPNNKEVFDLSKSFMRRLRKQKVRTEANIDDLCRSLVGATAIAKVAIEAFPDDVFHVEASIFGFTAIKATLDATSDQGALQPTQMVGILTSWGELQKYSSKNDDEIINELFVACETRELVKKFSLYELQHFVGSLETFKPYNSGTLMQQAGKRFLELVEQQCNLGSLNPSAVSSIIRCPVLLHRKSTKVVDPFVDASTHLFTDEEFLRNARLGELANFLWFMSTSHSASKESLTTLVRRILEFDLANSCSTKVACRILGAVTSVACLQYSKNTVEDGSEDLNDIGDLSSNLFHELGGHLLSSRMSPAEISSALSAYAKASYILDMGIYDHLVSQLALKIEDCSSRQLAQSLWACGKMVSFEGCGGMNDNDDENCGDPPYLEHAKEIAKALALRVKELSPRDVTQSTWAIGRLCIDDARLICSFAFRAKELSQKFNSAEIANIVWGLSKVGFSDREVILTLTDRLIAGDLQPKPQEISNVLYALGTLSIRDEHLFSELSDIMLENIENTSAQSIANALWAHRAVNIKPPRTLLNSWAVQKIGVIGIESIEF